MSQEIERCSD